MQSGSVCVVVPSSRVVSLSFTDEVIVILDGLSRSVRRDRCECRGERIMLAVLQLFIVLAHELVRVVNKLVVALADLREVRQLFFVR